MSHSPLKDLVASDEKWDSIVAQGWIVILTTPQFTVLISVYTFAFVFLAKRLFRVWTLLLFLWLLPESKRESRVDQLRVAAVNMRTPTDVLSESFSWRSGFKSKGVKRTFPLLWMLGALIFMVLGLASTYWLTLFPVANGVPGRAETCAAEVNFKNAPIDEQVEIEDILWRHQSQDALAQTDNNGYDYNIETEAGMHEGGFYAIAKSNDCPLFAGETACKNGDAMHFKGEFWIKPSDLGIGNVMKIDFGVGVDCYKVRTSQDYLGFDPNSVFKYRTFGLMYGERYRPGPNMTESNETTRVRREGVHGHGYSVSAFNYLQEDGPGTSPERSYWVPRADLHHEGDLSLLLYNLGATYSYDYSDDPLFRTILVRTENITIADNWADENLEERHNTEGRTLHKPANQTVAVICNNTYAICGGGKCSKLGGYHSLVRYINENQTQTANTSRVGFLKLMAIAASRPGMVAAVVDNGVLAASYLAHEEKIQPRIRDVKGHKELTRLFLASRTNLVLAAKRTAALAWALPLYQAGYNLYDVEGRQDSSIISMCEATLIRDPDCFTTSAKPWTIIACIWIFIVILTYSAPAFQKLQVNWISKTASRWRIREVGVLHSQLAEPRPMVTTEDKDKPVKSWPYVGKGDMPCVTYNGRGLTEDYSSMDIDELCIEDCSSQCPS